MKKREVKIDRGGWEKDESEDNGGEGEEGFDYSYDEEPAVAEKPRKKAKKGGESNLPLELRLQAHEEESVDAASTVSRRHTSARKRLKLERKRQSAAAATAAANHHANYDGDGDDEDGGEEEEGGDRRKKSKHAPAEQASNRPVRRLRDVVAPPPKRLDPRFSDLHGKLENKHFFGAYKFLDEYQEDEVNKLKRAMKRSKSVGLKADIKDELNKQKQELVERRRALKIQERMQALRAVEREKVAAGKKPFFPKRSAVRALALEERFDELKAAGGGKLKKFMEKKRMKNAKKDVRWLPNQRRDD
jgi:ribosomal RNA-processing protein 36